MGLQARIFAAMYDRIMSSTEEAGLRADREALLAGARGDVIEIGGGTGANLPFYGAAVTSVTVTEPEAPMAKRLERKLEGHRGAPAELVIAPAEQLPFEDDRFDTAVSTLVLCTVADQQRALAEIHRVLKPGGMLLFAEHVRSDSPRLARFQDRFNRVNRFVAAGCNCNRDTLDGISRAGFEVREVKHGQLSKAPPFVRPFIKGSAVAG
jgi:ubiquinone/menaquinone biosynthesis C-methylase UbiE